MVALVITHPVRRPRQLRLVPTYRPVPRYLVRRLMAMVVLAAALLVLMATGNAVISAVSGEAGTSAPSSVESVVLDASNSHVVAPGETLWSIARRVAPESDTRATVDALIAANGSPVIRAGQTLVLP